MKPDRPPLIEPRQPETKEAQPGPLPEFDEQHTIRHDLWPEMSAETAITLAIAIAEMLPEEDSHRTELLHSAAQVWRMVNTFISAQGSPE